MSIKNRINNKSTDKKQPSNKLGIISFGLLFIIILIMASATFVEHFYGTDVALKNIYHSYWFYILWGSLCILGTTFLFIIRPKVSRLVFFIHISLIVILLGAMVSYITSEKGYIHLKKGLQTNVFISKDDVKEIKLPFTVKLIDCDIKYYPGSSSPQDFVSNIIINESQKAKFTISMNNIAQYKGYRFYQNSFDKDLDGVRLLVNYDPFGTPITYIGYILFCIIFLCVLFSPKGIFHSVWKKVMRYSLISFLFLSFPFIAQSSPRKIPQDLAQSLGGLQMEYNGRVAPINTLATDFTHKLTGKNYYKDLTADQFFWSWIFYFDDWKKEPILDVKNKTIEKHLGKSKVSLIDLFSYQQGYALAPYLNIENLSKPTKEQSAALSLNDKVQLCMMLKEGQFLKLFPVKEDDYYLWLSPVDSLPKDMSDKDCLFIKHIFTLINECIHSDNSSEALTLTKKIYSYQHIKASSILLSPTKVKAEQVYNKYPIVSFLFKFNLTFGLIAFIIFILYQTNSLSILTKENSKWIWLLLRIALYTSTLLLAINFGLRSYIIQRLPLSNGYETMVSIAIITQITGAIFSRKFSTITAFTLLISGFLLLVASLSFMDPQITPLMPVLCSPLLSLHVSVIMIAYSFIAFTFLCSLSAGIGGLILYVKKENASLYAEKMQTMSLLFLYPALWLLAVGIFLGSVWANISWGSYWSWDPKEVWALITFLTYSVVLHQKSLPFIKKPLAFHIYMFLAFFTAVMTYWGVNYILGGMHSYS